MSFAEFFNRAFVQWAIDAMSPDKKDNVVKAKQMEALKRLGHLELKLDEYERTFIHVFMCISPIPTSEL